jgi:ribosome-binding protein aMBF1 (putative translation factor)
VVNLLTQRVKEYLDTAQTPAVIDQFPLAGDCMGINTRTQLQSALRSQRARLVKLSNRYDSSRKEPQRGSSEPTLGDRLRKARAHHGHKLAALAEKFDCEVSTLSNIERNVTKNPRLRLKQQIEQYIAKGVK